jgi:hypothetical protein
MLVLCKEYFSNFKIDSFKKQIEFAFFKSYHKVPYFNTLASEHTKEENDWKSPDSTNVRNYQY